MSDTRKHPVCHLVLEDELLIYRYLAGSQIDLAAAREVIELGTKLANGRRMPSLIDMGEVKGVDRSARIFFAESPENNAIVSHVAMVIASPISRMIGNFFLGINKPQAPTRLFTEESEARAWLSHMVEKDS